MEEVPTYAWEAGLPSPVPQAGKIRPLLPSRLPGLMEEDHSAFPELGWTSSQLFLALNERPEPRR
ncbi:MAG TPA: hypothetical protein DCM14_09815 [Clostridiales bacterium UBA8153]|nr:hypothetical protein [Clostridiales bacterium UBA8153]